MANIRIEQLNEAHQKSSFQSGNEALDQYLQKLATQHVRKNMAQVFVALDDDSPQVIGFYSLSSFSISFESLPESHKKRLPKYPIPCALIGRLAVNAQHKGRGLGKTLLIDALARIVNVSNIIAVHAIIVDAKDNTAREFYENYGFQILPDHPQRLFLPVETVRREFES